MLLRTKLALKEGQRQRFAFRAPKLYRISPSSKISLTIRDQRSFLFGVTASVEDIPNMRSKSWTASKEGKVAALRNVRAT